MRFELPADDGFFVVENPAQKAFQIYFLDGSKFLLAHYLSGRTQAVTENEIASSTDFAFRVPPSARFVYLQDTSEGPKNYPLALVSSERQLTRTNQIATLHGLFYGMLVIMVVYCLIMWGFTRNRLFLSYGAYMLFMMGLLASMDGFGRRLLWPQISDFAEYLPAIFLTAAMVALCQFAARYLRTARHFPGLHRLLAVLQIALVANTLLRVSYNHFLFIQSEPLLVTVICAVLIGMSLARSLAGKLSGRVLFAANVIMASGVAVYGLAQAGIVETTILARHGIHIGAVVHLTLLAAALGLQVRNTDRERAKYQSDARELNHRVMEMQSAQQLAEEYRQLRSTLQNAQAQRTLGQMAGGLAHEFNNRLAGILGFAELARNNPGNAHKVDGYLAEIQRGGNRASELVQQLLLYSRQAQPNAEVVELNRSVMRIIEFLRSSLASTVTIEWHSEVSDHEAQSRLDPGHLQQMVTNICLNAAEAMQHQGAIQLRLERRNCQEITCASCASVFSGDYLMLECIDQGPGLTGNAFEAFQPFFSTKQSASGRGLGLSVVHGIAHEIGGHVQLHNRTEIGCRCAVFLPVTANVTSQLHRQPRRVLIVEKDEQMRRYLHELLASADFGVTATAVANEALERFVDKPDDYDLVIADMLRSPGEELEFVRDMRSVRPDLPVIVTTPRPDDLSYQDAAQRGIQAVFAKPLDADLLLAKVSALLQPAGTEHDQPIR